MSVSGKRRPRRPRLVFLSYSRRDRGLVSKLQLVIWAAGMLPWRDEDHIDPAANWRMAIAQSIDDCERVVLFWCRHANTSTEVQNEYEYAITRWKPIAPLLLDRTPLPDALHLYQAKDVRGLAWWRHEVFRWELMAWAAGLVLLVVGSVYAAR